MRKKIRYLNKKFLISLLIIIILLIIISIFSLAKGSVYLSNSEIWLAIFKQGEEINQTIIWELRLPRFSLTYLRRGDRIR